MAESIMKIVLANGLRVILVPRASVDTVTVSVTFGVGSRYETAELNGAAHFIEHMMFKGTARRPTGVDISRILDAVGADHNACTGEEYTDYHIRLHADRLELAMDMLSDMLFGSLFRPEDIDIERGAILQEARGGLDDSDSRAYHLVQEALFPAAPLGRPVVGTVDSINGLDRGRLLGFRNEHYLPTNAVAAVAGRFDEDKVRRLLEAHFGPAVFPAAADGRSALVLPAMPSGGPRARLHRRADAEQASVFIGFGAYGHDDQRLPALEVLTNILGGTASSRLFASVREQRGLAYSIWAYPIHYRGIGSLLITAGLAQEKLEPAIGLIVDELIKLRSEGVTAEELAAAKENLCGTSALHLESPRAVARHYVMEELLVAQPQTIQGSWDATRAVTAAEVRQAAAEVLRADSFRLAVVSPFDDPAPYLAQAARLGG